MNGFRIGFRFLRGRRGGRLGGVGCWLGGWSGRWLGGRRSRRFSRWLGCWFGCWLSCRFDGRPSRWLSCYLCCRFGCWLSRWLGSRLHCRLSRFLRRGRCVGVGGCGRFKTWSGRRRICGPFYRRISICPGKNISFIRTNLVLGFSVPDGLQALLLAQVFQMPNRNKAVNKAKRRVKYDFRAALTGHRANVYHSASIQVPQRIAACSGSIYVSSGHCFGIADGQADLRSCFDSRCFGQLGRAAGIRRIRQGWRFAGQRRFT